MKLIDFMREWVEKQFNPKYWDCVFSDLIDVAAGNRPGNKFEREAVKMLVAEHKKIWR